MNIQLPKQSANAGTRKSRANPDRASTFKTMYKINKLIGNFEPVLVKPHGANQYRSIEGLIYDRENERHRFVSKAPANILRVIELGSTYVTN